MITRLLTGLGFLCLAFNDFGQDLKQAEQLSREGKFDEAESVYRILLVQNPSDQQALVKSAYNLSWNRQFKTARERFGEAMKLKPGHEEALAGVGYTYIWDHNPAKAARYFTEILNNNPESKEGRKGMAYVWLNKNNLKKAATAFSSLAQQYPNETEFPIALAQIYIRRGYYSMASKYLNNALRQEPGNEAVIQQLAMLKRAPAFAEFDTWGGYASSGDVQNTGIRNLAVAIAATPATKAIFRFDNNLSLDNRFFAQQRLNANAFFAGAIHDWNSRLTTRAELGYRTIPGKGSQQLFAAEQVIFIHRGDEEQRLYNIKLGAFAATGNLAGNEYMVYSGLSIPISSVLYAEPGYYYSTVAQGNIKQHRIQGGLKFLNRKMLEITGGGFWGKEFSPLISRKGSLYGSYLMAIYPIRKKMGVMVFARNEWGANDNLFSAGLGVKLKLYR
jgi:Flp pilus assembly protein TadD